MTVSVADLESATRRLEEIVKERMSPPGAGWRWIHSQVSAIPDVMYPHDPAVMRAINNEFDSRVIPLNVKRVYQSQTGGQRVIVVHCIGSHVWNPTEKPAAWTERGALMPTAGPNLRPVTHIDFHHENKNLRKHDLRRYIPFDWRLYVLLRGMYDEHTRKERLKWMEENSAETKAAQLIERRGAESEAEARKRGPWLREKIENMVRDKDALRIADELKHKKSRPFIVVPGRGGHLATRLED